MNFGISDFFDVILIAVFIYSALIWFQRTASQRVVIGICLLTAVYVLARQFDLYLTQMLFRTIFTVLLIALVVVFQEEIRRAFERIALWGTFRDRRRYAGIQGADALIEAIAGLAANRIGTLIVIKGNEELDRHIDGGIPLHGKVSKPLLFSIFDPHSPGHDGAVLIEGDRVTKFGAHLPLSKNLAQVGSLGTRHTAALGISECTDAFVIGVSEESGTIRVAQDGQLRTMGSVAELKGRLERFYQEKFPRRSEPEWKRFFRQGARLKALSLVLALSSWFMFAYRTENVQRTFAVPVEYRNLPAGWTIEGVKTPETMVTLTGSQREFSLLNPSALVISIDLSDVEEGTQRFIISEDDLRRPANVSVYRIEPNLISVEAYRTAVMSLPVEVVTQGKLPPDLRLVSIKPLPNAVQARIRVAQADKITSILTEPVDLDGITQTELRKVPLQLPPTMQLLEPEWPQVQVTIEVEKLAPPQEPKPKE